MKIGDPIYLHDNLFDRILSIDYVIAVGYGSITTRNGMIHKVANDIILPDTNKFTTLAFITHKQAQEKKLL